MAHPSAHRSEYKVQATGRTGLRSGTWALVLPFLLPSGCRSNTSKDLVEQERLDVLTWFIPKGATIIAGSGIDRHGLVRRAVSDISTTLTWDEYRRWVDASERAGYHRTGTDRTSASFVRTLSGDEFRVDLEIALPGPPLRVRMTFTATPD
jgi:hypothetical protein